MDKLFTEFGKYLSVRQISYATVAQDLGVTRSYISMLATGKATPGLALAGEIEDWTQGEVTIRSWYDFLKQVQAARSAAPAAQLTLPGVADYGQGE